MKITIVGCGNIVRSDDGAGPYVIRLLWEMGPPPYIKLIDGGTSGIDVIYHIQGSDEAVFIDACQTGEEPGTIYEVPAEEVEELPSNEEANLHSIKWFHAIALAKHLLKEGFPKRIRVFLIEGKNFSVGEGLSEEVKRSAEKLANFLAEEYMKGRTGSFEVELLEDGYLKIPSEVANKYFENSLSVAVIPQGMELRIIPLPNSKQGGILLKRINKKGDRAVLIWEFLPPGIRSGKKKAVWDEEKKELVVSLI